MGVRIPSADGVGPLVSGLYYRAALHLQDSSGRLGVLPKVTQQLGPDSVSESRCGGLCQDPPPPPSLAHPVLLDVGTDPCSLTLTSPVVTTCPEGLEGECWRPSRGGDRPGICLPV